MRQGRSSFGSGSIIALLSSIPWRIIKVCMIMHTIRNENPLRVNCSQSLTATASYGLIVSLPSEREALNRQRMMMAWSFPVVTPFSKYYIIFVVNKTTTMQHNIMFPPDSIIMHRVAEYRARPFFILLPCCSR